VSAVRGSEQVVAGSAPSGSHEPDPKELPPRASPRGHAVRWVALGALVVLVVLAIVVATRPSQQATAVQSPLLGKRAPAFTARTLDGGSIDLAQFHGHYVLLNFFASWCPPCQQEEPDLVRFAFDQGREANGARLVSVVFDDPDAAARQFVEQWGTTWPSATDPGGEIASDYGVTAPPTTFLIGPSGTVVGELTGPVTVAQLDRLLAAARRDAG
jgi:cytochrome c biogenesis protein CcmG, thiol:disulfide interchange protein DsbE